MNISYKPKGVCSKLIEIEVLDGVVKELRVTGGCDGNLKGISSLVCEMEVSEVIKRLEGIMCGNKPTSCPDQIAKALRTCVSGDTSH